MVRSRDGERLTPGGRARSACAGAGLFSAYYSPWMLREAIARDGWFMTGDIGRLDEIGGLHLKGRKKSVIFVGGLKFFPDEVEACINQLPGIEESRVFGRAHPRLGEVPCAEIVARSRIRSRCAPRALLGLLSPGRCRSPVARCPEKGRRKVLTRRRGPRAAAGRQDPPATAPVGRIRDEPAREARPPASALRVAIVGAGPAGAALAILLARQGAASRCSMTGVARSCWWASRSSRPSCRC